MKKNLLKNAFYGIMSVAIVATAMSCGDDDSTPTAADKAELNVLITECDGLANAAAIADYPQAAIDAFKTVLAAAKTVTANAAATQEQVDNVKVQLTNAKETFLAAAYSAIPAAALIFGLGFDEGSGSTLTLAGKAGITAAMEAGYPVFGAETTLPTWVPGHNDKGTALHFDKSSHVKIANYSRADLEGFKLSIALWAKPDETRENNYIISYNSWHSWKFGLQNQNKAFFTVSTGSGAADADNEADFSVPNAAWTHVVISLDLTAGTLDMYINGALSKHWTKEQKPALTGTIAGNENALPLTIGAFYSSLEDAAFDWEEWPNKPKEEITSWFAGVLDEVKVYNIALTEGQVSKLYNDEK
jgi:hypothetical protein